MESPLTGTAALVTGASSGIGAATARRLARDGACVALVARRRDCLQALAAGIDKAGGTALVVEADITDRTQAEAAVQQAAGRFGRLDTLVNNAGLMLLGPIAGADPEEWDRMIAVNVQGLLYTTRATLPHLLQAAQQSPRRVANIVNISSIAGRVAWNGYGVYSLTKFGVNGFTESLRQELTQRHVRVGLVEPGGVATELGSHNKPEIRNEMIDPFYEQTEVQQHQRAVHGEQLVVLLIGHDVLVRAEQLDPHDQRHDPGAQEEEERGDQVQVPDDLVVGRGQPEGEDVSLTLGPRRLDDAGLLFGRVHRVLPRRLLRHARSRSPPSVRGGAPGSCPVVEGTPTSCQGSRACSVTLPGSSRSAVSPGLPEVMICS